MARDWRRTTLGVVLVVALATSWPSGQWYAGICALAPAPLSKPLARAPSVALDRLDQRGPLVSFLPEPVERPLKRYLHKFDHHFQRIVPDWDKQYKTVEQQFLYGGDFSIFVREVTAEGAIVQDSVTGLMGFVDKENAESYRIPLRVGMLIHGARCTFMDNTVIMSADTRVVRDQTGIVWEWDDASGHGYIMPTEEQAAYHMLRVLRRDVVWHGAHSLTPGQFVTFQTAVPGEVPIDQNDEPNAPFALRVQSPELTFSLEHVYDFQDPKRWEQKGITDKKRLEYMKKDLGSDRAAKELFSQRGAMPAMSGRQEKASPSHPLLQKFAESKLSYMESPSWLWEPALEWKGDDTEHPIIPVQLEPVQELPYYYREDGNRKRILAHEVGLAMGGDLHEQQARQAYRDRVSITPPGRGEAERRAIAIKKKQELKLLWQERREALLEASKYKQSMGLPESRVA